MLRRSCLWAGLLVLLVSPAVSAVTFHTTLSSVKVYGRPGQVVTKTFQLTLDPGQPKTRFRAHIEDWWRSEDGRQSFYEKPGTLMRSCGTWVAVNPVEQEISAGETLTIRETITVSTDATSGGYWCVLTVDELADPLATEEGVDMKFLASVSTGIFVYIDPLQPAATITDVSVSQDAAIVTVRNDGNVPVPIEGRFEFIRPGTGTPVAVVRLARSTLLTEPIVTGRFSAPLPDSSVLPSDRYLVRVIVDYGVDHYIGVQRELDLTRGESVANDPVP